MRLADLVAASAAVAGTRSRTAKIAALAALLRTAEPDEVGLAARYLAGQTRQERLDVGWRTVHEVAPTPAATPTLTLVEVDRALRRLADAQGAGSRTLRRQVVSDLLGRATADEQRFLRALLLGELRQGALAGVAAQALALAAGVEEAAVRRALLLRPDLGTVAEAAFAGAMADFRLTPFQALQPMLASTAASVRAAVTRPVLVEWKLDGTRVQAHRDGEEVRVYSRLLRDVTARSGAVVQALRDLRAERIVLDGEVLAVDAAGRPAAFQDTMRSLGREGGVRPFFFDVLHVDGRDLLDEPLTVRREALAAAVPEALRVPGEVVADAEGAGRVYAAALDAGHEGVVVKALGASYQAGRRGAAWQKLKPVRTLDLVVLAVEWGSGRRTGWLSNLHLGARDPAAGGFVMLGKTFKGMTDAMLAWQTERFLALERDREGHVVLLRPEQVVEIAFDGVQRSSRYPGGVTLRFARVLRYRDDKPAEQADTVDAVRAFHTARLGREA